MCCLVRSLAHPDDHALLPDPYVNASRIPPLPESSAGAASCIASQAPTPPTFGAFYHHLCAERVGVLLNLTPLVERDMIKSHQYWPSSTSAPIEEGEWVVQMLGEEPSETSGLTLRRLQLTHGEASHQLTLLHYTGWQDHGALPTPQLMGLLTAVEQARLGAEAAPLWVHCSAGIGRSGTLIGAFLAQQLPAAQRTAVPSMDLAAYITRHMRHFRAGMVQTPGQLVTLASAIELAAQASQS